MLQSSPRTSLFIPLPIKVPLPSLPPLVAGCPHGIPFAIYPSLSYAPSLSRQPSKSFPPTAHTPTTLWASRIKATQYSSNPALFYYSLCPFHNCPFPLHSMQGVSLSCPLGDPMRTSYPASPRISCYYRYSSAFCNSLSPCFSVCRVKSSLRFLKQMGRRHLGSSLSLKYPPFL